MRPYVLDHHLFHWNSELEVLHLDQTMSPYSHTLVLESESGVVYNQIPNVKSYRLEEVGGETKVLVRFFDATTSVYRIGPPVSVATVDQPETDFSLFPNPAQDQVQVKCKGNTEWQTLRIYNLQGQVVQTEALQGRNGLNVNLENLAPGYYQLQMSGPEGNKVKPFVVN